MKKLIMALVAVMMLSVAATAGNIPIRYDKLPQQSKTFVKKYWLEANLNLIYKTDFGYEVRMDNGVTVKFDRSGRWFSMTGFDALPTGMLPQGIMRYMDQYYPDEIILSVKKHSRGYDVTVTKGLVMKYTLQGKFIRLD